MPPLKLRPETRADINSTYYGGGVAEILSSLTLLMGNALQHRAAIVLQKSLREGFGLTIA
jgi:hypothetical protein